MEELAMCRVCLAEDVRLRLIANTHLQEMYESLTLLPLETRDSRPIGVCYICCAELQNCYRLKKRCLRSEELLTHMLSNDMLQPLNVQEDCTQRLRVEHPVILLNIGDELQNDTDDDATEDSAHRTDTPDVLDYDEVLLQHNEGACISKKNEIAALKNSEDKIKVEKYEDTETITIKEPKNVTNRKRIKKPVTTSKILETCEKLDIKLNKCEKIVTSIVHNVCEEKSTNNTSLEHTVSSISVTKNKQFTCDTCNKCFTKNDNLKKHIRLHSAEKPHSCVICKKGFKIKSNLIKHNRIHTGEKPFRCDVCTKCFSEQGDLKRHIRTHTGERPYKCNVCKKCFTIKSSLETHIRTHTGEKPYECTICKKCFIQQSNLTKHIRTHTSEKRYECSHCKTCFFKKSVLKRHICY